jgi:single-stranded-DNA-specific exonuclease
MHIKERPINQEVLEHLIENEISPVMAKLWASRGIQHASELSLQISQLIPPNDLKGCQEAAQYLAQALAENRKIVIVADYDCDGATACAVGILGLEELGQSFNSQIDFIVPNRFTMGYGLTPEVVELAANRNPRPEIIITVDNGIASIDGVAYANRLGIDVIVTDHHLPADELPKAKHIVNPNQPGCTFSSKALAGVGVMFYLLLAVRAELRDYYQLFTKQTQPQLLQLLDLVALGTVADVAQLDRNNRILVSARLKRIRQGLMSPGIEALFHIAGKSPGEANTFDLGFSLGPRLNAAGRLADMTLGIQCLLSKDLSQAKRLAHELDQMNRERRSIENEMKVSAQTTMAQLSVEGRHALTLFEPSWHQGVIGILASRLKDEYHRPVIVFALAEEKMPDGKGILKGSGRSITGFHMRDALDWISKKYPQMILKFGGHAMAAGLSIPEEDLASFEQAFAKIALQWIEPDALNRTIMHDGTLPIAQMNQQFAEQLSTAIWGQGFPEPVFVGRFEVIKQTTLKGRHLKVELIPIENGSSNQDSQSISGIWFGHSENLPPQTYLAYRLLVDHYLNYPRLQIHIETAFN